MSDPKGYTPEGVKYTFPDIWTIIKKAMKFTTTW